MKITLFWLAGTGTSTVGKLLAQKLSYEFHSTGNIMREWAREAWLSIYDFEDQIAKKDESFDIQLDQRVHKFWKTHDNFVFESRLAWHFIEDSYKIALMCDDDTRYARIHEREWWELWDTIEKTLKREQELITRYSEIYSEIVFPPSWEVFDLVIDSWSSSPDIIVDRIIKEIKR